MSFQVWLVHETLKTYLTISFSVYIFLNISYACEFVCVCMHTHVHINVLTFVYASISIQLQLGFGKGKKSKSTSEARKGPSEDYRMGGANGDAISDRVDVESIADYEVNERFEKMLVSIEMFFFSFHIMQAYECV